VSANKRIFNEITAENERSKAKCSWENLVRGDVFGVFYAKISS